MSAYIVDKETIDMCVTAVLRTPEIAKNFTDEDKDSIGQVLWEENWRSIAHLYKRYPDGERPGPVGFRLEEVADYRYTEPVAWIQEDLDAAMSEYNYQSCEHPGWEDSLAQSLIHGAIVFHGGIVLA